MVVPAELLLVVVLELQPLGHVEVQRYPVAPEMVIDSSSCSDAGASQR